MTDLNRRLFIAGSAAAPVAVVATGAKAAISDMTLYDALMARQSTRRFGNAPVPEEQLLRILWAANGVNRPDTGYTTAPTWRSAHDTEVFVATAEGLFRYDNLANALEKQGDDDIRAISSDSAFVARAPALLIFVSRRAPLSEAAEGATEEAFAIGAHVNAAIVGQNVYLACAAEGLGTCMIGGAANRTAIAEALSLSDGDIVTYIQPLGAAR